MLTLTVAAAAGSTFAGWSGDCSGSTSCQVTLSADKTLSATFTATPGAKPQPSITTLTQSALVWREGSKLPHISTKKRPPLGGVDAQTVRNWIRSGKLPAVSFGPDGTLVRVDPAELDKLRQPVVAKK
jgi:hypothetical protein